MKKTTLRSFAVAAAVPGLVASCLMASSGAAPAPDALSFTPSGLVGGGFVNTIAVDPAGSGLVLAGGDVSGFHRSMDWGQHWVTSNAGVDLPAQLSVADIEFSVTQPGTVFAAVGVRGSGGGLLRSQDGGQTWSLRSGVPQFSGANNVGIKGLPHTHPRSTGTLLALDEEGGFLYAATFEQGVLRSADGGSTWTVLGLAGTHLRGLALDPADPDTLYAAAYDDGVYRTTTASTAGTFLKLGGSPATPEELRLIGGNLYVAGGKAGVFRSPDGGLTWEQLGIGRIPVTEPSWMSVDGYSACDRDVVYVGANGAGPDTVMRSTDGGATWASVTGDATLVHPTIGGPDGTTWWLAKQARMMLGGSFSAAAQIAVGPGPAGGDACLRDRVLVAGRAGVWGSVNTGTDWYPMVDGLGVTIARDVAVDPGLAGRAYVATADWVFHHSADGLVHVTQKKPSGGTTAADIAIDASTAPGRVYVATGNPSANTNGEVFSNPNPLTSGWTDEGLSSVAGGKRPLALVVRKVGGGRVLLVAVDGGGIWRKAGTTWTRVNAVAMGTSQPTRGASLVWPAGSATVYLYDRQSGVWRSGDNGRNWTKIWSAPSPFPMTGYLAVDPASPGRLFVSIGGAGVYRIDGATSGSVDAGTLTPVEVGAFAGPGPVEFGPSGELYVAAEAAPGLTPGLYRSDDLGSTWVLVSDAFYRAAAGFPFDMAVAPDGTVSISTNGDGVIVGRPA